MDKAVIAYKKRRQARLDAKNGKEPKYDIVEEFRKRRNSRLEARMDAGIGWAYGLAKSKGIDTEGMTPEEVFEALKEKGTGRSAKIKGRVREKSRQSGDEHARGKNAKNEKSSSRNNRLDKECDGKGYKGKPGEVVSGKGGKLAPKSDAAKKIDTADAMAETELWKSSGGKKGIPKNSLSDHIDENGNLTPERQKVHDEIVQRFFADKMKFDGTPTMIMSGGGPASGKSFVSKNAESKFGKDSVVVVDPDEFKKMLPGFGDMAVAGDKAAGFYHEESSALAKRIYQYAAENGINVVYDGTGDGSVKSVMKKLKTAQDAGYKVTGEYVTVDVDGDAGALVRNRERYEHAQKDWDSGKKVDPPRLVKDTHVRDIHAKVSDIGPDVAPLFDEWTLTDNNVPRGAPRPIIARCKKGGEIEVVKGMEDKVQAWLDKGTRGGKVVNGKVVFPKKK